MQLDRLFFRTYTLFRDTPRLLAYLAIPYAASLLALAAFLLLQWGPVSSLAAQLESNTISLDMARLIESAQSRVLTLKILAAPVALLLVWLWFYCSGRFIDALLRASGAAHTFARGPGTLPRMTLSVVVLFLVVAALLVFSVGGLSFGLAGAIVFLFSLWLLGFLVLLFWYVSVILRTRLLPVLMAFLLLIFRHLPAFLSLLVATAGGGLVVFALLGFPLELLFWRLVLPAIIAFFIVAILLFPLVAFLAGSWGVFTLASLERMTKRPA